MSESEAIETTIELYDLTEQELEYRCKVCDTIVLWDESHYHTKAEIQAARTRSAEEEKLIMQEVLDHEAYWRSDRAKRITVEKHLTEKGVKHVKDKIDTLIQSRKLMLIPKPKGDYLSVPVDSMEKETRG
jgi:hypothetical protein